MNNALNTGPAPTPHDEADVLHYAETPANVPSDDAAPPLKPWCVLLVDDDPDVHAVTRLSLHGFMFENRSLDLVSAYSGAQGRAAFESRSDIALAIVDIIMETEYAGLELVRYVRNDLHNHLTRLVMRTGQSGMAPEDGIIRDYEIDDYKHKTELTAQKMYTLLYSKLRAYRDLCAVEAQRNSLELTVAQRTSQLADLNQALREDVMRRERAELALLERNAELQTLNAQLSSAQDQLIQSEKLSSIGQLAAGVAHEINNPIGYIFSNYGTLETYLADLFRMLNAYEEAESFCSDPKVSNGIAALKADLDLPFLKEDIPTLMRESKEGIVRVRGIVQDLKDFSHVDALKEWQYCDLNRGIESTLNVANNEIKYKADVVRRFGDLPEVQCMSSEINQVVLNLLVNAAHAMGPDRGVITVETGTQGASVWIAVTDTGSGIAPDVLPRIFDPFFTTKPVGKGTGLGLSLSYGIVQKHKGRIQVQSELGKGTRFCVTIPICQSCVEDASSKGTL